MFRNFLKNLSILKKFFIYKFIIFIINFSLTIIYLSYSTKFNKIKKLQIILKL